MSGVASASDYRSRVASSPGRLTQYLSGSRARTWHMVVADDHHLESGGPLKRIAVLHTQRPTWGYPGARLLVATLLSGSGSNFSVKPDARTYYSVVRNGSRGGLRKRRQRRLSARLDSRRCSAASCTWSRALEYGRPFLAPVHEVLTRVLRCATSPQEQMIKTRDCNCAMAMDRSSMSPRVDARTKGSRLMWGRHPRFSSRSTAAARQKRQLIVAILDALAIRVALKTFCGQDTQTHRTKDIVVPSLTGNRGDSARVNTLMTTKFPASAILNGTSSVNETHGATNQCRVAASGNQAADALSNGVCDSFDRMKRIHVSSDTLHWDIVPQARRTGKETADVECST